LDASERLRIDGLVDRPLELGAADLAAFPPGDLVADASRFQPGRRGGGVLLEPLLARAGVKPEANYLTLHAARDDFHVSIPLEPVRAEAIVLYHVEGRPMTRETGGPFRFLIRDPAACHTDELDDCANVKYLDRIELSVRKGRDTRPRDEAEHAALHAREGHPD
jgi:DMSO/TMAO reductase YedYZ molybdopterin-dependent catalytic subunit